MIGVKMQANHALIILLGAFLMSLGFGVLISRSEIQVESEEDISPSYKINNGIIRLHYDNNYYYMDPDGQAWDHLDHIIVKKVPRGSCKVWYEENGRSTGHRWSEHLSGVYQSLLIEIEDGKEAKRIIEAFDH